MKLSRHKFIRRLLNYYRTHFNIEIPFIILIDGTFAFEALQWKIQIDEQLKSYLETDQIICSTTLCAIKETELLGGIAFGAMLILKQYEIIKCHHYPSISAEKCFEHVLIKDKTKKYFLASQVCFILLWNFFLI
jgi:U3 small nucleolar RNA-associated protein 23